MHETVTHSKTADSIIIAKAKRRNCNTEKFSIRAVAPSPAGPAMARLFFAAGTNILNIEDMPSKYTFKLGGGYWPKVKQRSKSGVVLLKCCRT